MKEPQMVEMMSGRQFATKDDPLPFDLETDVVLDVVILARVVRKEDIGTGDSGIVIIPEIQTDELMLTGILARAHQIDLHSNFVNVDGDD